METRKKIKIYIAGPMRTIQDFNREEFNSAERSLKSKGVYAPVNPVTLDKESGLTDEELSTRMGLRLIMKRDIEELLKCEQIFMLIGWEKSEGARIEHALASMVGMYIQYQ